MPLLANSQGISKGDFRGTPDNPITYTDSIPRGTLIGTTDALGNLYLHMHVEDAKLILTDLLDYELIVDSILPEYERKDSLHNRVITLNLTKIAELQLQSDNQKEQLKNLNAIIDNVKEINGFKDLTVENAKKAVKTEKIKKGLALGGGTLGGVGLGIILGFFLAK